MIQDLAIALQRIRNATGRLFGAPAKTAYNPIQHLAAKAVWDFWMGVPGCNQLDAAAWCGNTDGETSFLVGVRGDKGLAGGMAQWHQQRRDIILKGTGIDVWTADFATQCRAVLWEVSELPSAYRKVLGHLQAKSTVADKVQVLVHEFEQSGSQARDVARRTMLANYWLGQFGNPNVPPNDPSLVAAAFSNM